MEEDLEFLRSEIAALQIKYGIGITVMIVIRIIAVIVSYKYINSVVDHQVQANFNHKFEEFRLSYNEQRNALAVLNKSIVNLNRSFGGLVGGDRYAEQKDLSIKIETLLGDRRQFIETYEDVKVMVPLELCSELDKLRLALDRFLDVFTKGLFEPNPEMDAQNAELNGGMYIAGIWPSGALDSVLASLKTNQLAVEKEIRALQSVSG